MSRDDFERVLFVPNWLKFDAKRNLYRLFKQENFHNESDQYMDMVRQCINQAWDKWQNVAAPDSAARIAEQDARIKELEQQLEVVRKDSLMWRAVSFPIEELIRNGMCNAEIEDAYDAAIRQIGGAE